jgi:hypothetical protein
MTTYNENPDPKLCRTWRDPRSIVFHCIAEQRQGENCIYAAGEGEDRYCVHINRAEFLK